MCSIKESIDALREMIDEEKESLSSEAYLNLMNGLSKMNDNRNENVYVKLTLLHQELKSEHSTDEFKRRFVMSKHIEKKYYPLSVFRNHYGTERDDYIATFDDIKQHQYNVINIVNSRTKTDLIMLNDNSYRADYHNLGDEEDDACLYLDVKYANYILLDCELV
jgi:hypothetical protein|tara:strand:+ start:1318 stop:1809 length:492 start_codon:yes stop_codon:yes gene_type:complete